MSPRLSLVPICLASALLLGGCNADPSTRLLEAAAIATDVSGRDAIAFKDYVADAEVYVRADRVGEIINIYMVPFPVPGSQQASSVPAYLSKASYDEHMAHLGPPLTLKGREMMRLTRGRGIVFNLGSDRVLNWAPDYADDVRDEWNVAAPR